MDKMNDFESSLVVKAVLVWTGWGRDVMPRRDDSLLVEHFGVEAAAKLLPVVKSLENDFYSSDARYVAVDLKEMKSWLQSNFERKTPVSRMK